MYTGSNLVGVFKLYYINQLPYKRMFHFEEASNQVELNNYYKTLFQIPAAAQRRTKRKRSTRNMSSEEKDVPQNTQDLTVFVQNLLQQMVWPVSFLLCIHASKPPFVRCYVNNDLPPAL